MAKRPARDLTIGALFALALIVLALGVMAVGGESGLFLKRARVGKPSRIRLSKDSYLRALLPDLLRDGVFQLFRA